jgi:5'-nucleotidase / UDP-sugar diphosphatase
MSRMNSRARAIVAIAAVLIAATLSASQTPPRPATAQAPATLTILHFNDVYEIDAVEGGHSGGLARVATVVDSLKRSNSPLLVTLGGDYLSPSAIGTARVNGEVLAGRQMVDVLNEVGLNWATFGNHEFDIPEAAFHARMAESKFQIVSSNVTDLNDKPFEHTVASAVVPIRAGGRTLRIGLIGLTIDSNRKTFVKYLPPIDAARQQLALLAGKTDAIIAITHLTLATDQELVTALPQIDLVLGGHEHENWLMRRGPAFTPVVKADANVRSVAIVTMAFGRQGTRPAVSARLRVIDDAITPKVAVDRDVKLWTSRAFDAFRKDGFEPSETVVTVPEPLDGRESTVRNHPGNLTDLITAAMAHEVPGAEVAILNGGSVRIDDVLPAGPLRVYDVIRVLPFGGKVLKASFDGSLLTSVLDIGLTNQGTGGYLQIWGATHEGNVWRVGGQPIDPTRRYTVAIAEFLLTGGETRLDFLKRTNPQVHDVEELRDVRSAVIDELKRRYR